MPVEAGRSATGARRSTSRSQRFGSRGHLWVLPGRNGDAGYLGGNGRVERWSCTSPAASKNRRSTTSLRVKERCRPASRPNVPRRMATRTVAPATDSERRVAAGSCARGVRLDSESQHGAALEDSQLEVRRSQGRRTIVLSPGLTASTVAKGTERRLGSSRHRRITISSGWSACRS